VTGVAGFIGFFLAKRLLEQGCSVIGIDNINDYYDINLKYARLDKLKPFDKFTFIKEDISNKEMIMSIFNEYKPAIVINLAAQAGVRYSIENPDAFIQNNIVGFFNILEACRNYPVEHLIYASSSSVYGSNKKVPFEETDSVDCPVSLYAATKKANETLAYSYHHLYGIEVAGLRFFTVYGPFGRPDMAIFKFCKNILTGKEINVYNNGKMSRNFTFVSDVIDGIIGCINKKDLKYEIYNLGGDKAVPLMVFIRNIEKNMNLKAKIKFLPMQAGDVQNTIADISKAKKDFGYCPKVNIDDGMKIFCDWFLENKNWLLKLKDPKQ
jgi:UDP-glucuronate 4-epimerase